MEENWTGDVYDVMPGSAEDFGDLKKSSSWDSSLQEGSWFVGVYELCRVFVEEIVSLASYVEKP